MNNFNFYSPTYFAFGKDKETEAGALVKRFGGSRVLLHFGGQSAKKSGLLDRVKASLEKEQEAVITRKAEEDLELNQPKKEG